MTLNEQITLNYDKWLIKIKNIVPEDEAGDVLNSVLLSMMERNINVDNDIDCLECYIVSSCKIAYRSPNSPYNRQLGRHIKTINFDDAISTGIADEEITDDEEDKFKNIDIIKLIQESPFSWYEKELFKRRLLENNGKTLKEMAKECNLSPSQVWYSHRKVKNYLKEKIKELN